MIEVERRDGRIYCTQVGCGKVLDGLRDRGHGVDPSGWWDVIRTGPDERLLRWNDQASHRRRARAGKRRRERLDFLHADHTDAKVEAEARGQILGHVDQLVPLPITVKCPHCHTALKMGIDPQQTRD